MHLAGKGLLFRRRHRRLRTRSKGFVLIALLALLTMGGLYFLVSNLTPAAMDVYRQKKTEDALIQAREALLGYVLSYRDTQASKDADSNDADDRVMYGYLPLPDLGSSRNNNQLTDTSCYGMEGCEAYNFLGNGINVTVIGRFPWRTLGTGPLRDGHGECLWYAVSGSHQRNQPSSPMNWDTQGHIDIVTANDAASLASIITSAHDRPVAVIFSPGAILAGQDRSAYGAIDNVTECGGNYNVKNYLDPGSVALGTTTNYFPDDSFQDSNANYRYASAGTSTIVPKPLSVQGKVYSEGSLLRRACSSDSTNCQPAANDQGLAITSDELFTRLRKGQSFRTDINSMLDRMVACLRDQIAAGSSFTPDSIAGYASPADKTAGRIATDTCYNDDQHPLGYFSHYKDQIFVAKPTSGSFTVNGANCGGVLIFAGQRGTKTPSPTTRSGTELPANDALESTKQLRTTDAVSANNAIANNNWLPNYLEGSNSPSADSNLRSFMNNGYLAFTGDTSFTATGGANDTVFCIPASANLSAVESPNLSAAEQLVTYNTATSTLTLGKTDIDSNHGYSSSDLFGCGWMADSRSINSGFRSYFTFSFATVGTSVGNTGFVFAAIDAESNTSLPCGSGGNHLAYSGDANTSAAPPYIAYPKIGIEFDQSRNTGFNDGRSETATNKGRNDPCYTCFPTNATSDSHAAIVYWGNDASNATDLVTQPNYDDNVHGYPSTGSILTTRQPPRNPSASPGIENITSLRTGGKLFHVRVEVTPTREINASAENSKTSVQTKVWILADGATVTNQIAAMKNTTRPMSQLLTTGFDGTLLSDTAAIFDVAGSACSAGTCPTNQTCGTDNICYRQGLRTVRLGFTGSQRTQDQNVTISNIFTTWLP